MIISFLIALGGLAIALWQVVFWFFERIINALALASIHIEFWWRGRDDRW